MNRQRVPENDPDPEVYKSLLPEIARLLNISVSMIERYPSDIKTALCDIYTDHYHSDSITIKQALSQVVQLNAETQKQIEQAKQKEPQQQEQLTKKLSTQAVLSREQILESGRILAERDHQRKIQQAQNKGYEQERKYNES